MQVLLDEYMLCYFGCVLPALRSHDKETEEEGENETEILHRDITLVRLYIPCTENNSSFNCTIIF